MKNYTCRICRSPNHSVILDYGSVALAGALLANLDEAKHEQRYPLTLVLCEECKHVQIREIVDPTVLFTDYAWQTGVGMAILKYVVEFAQHVAVQAKLPPSGFVVEIASNDGTLLGEFAKSGRRVLGVDPARKIAESATAKGIPTLPTFFNLQVARNIVSEHGQAQLIVGRNVLAHVAELHGLVEGVRTLLASGGTAVIEVPHLVPMYHELQYDQVYHEHIGYHSLDSIRWLAAMHALRVIDVETAPMHGGSIRAYLAHAADARAVSSRVDAMLAEEAPLLTTQAWAQFGDRAREQKRLLRAELEVARARSEVVVGYGASGKGQALIQFCELDGAHVNYIVDKAAIKHGKFTPGSHIPIHDVTHMKEAGVDILVLLSWNLAEEILHQERELHAKGVRFLHPIPVPHYL